MHFDHIGLADRVRATSGALVALHPADAEHIASPRYRDALAAVASEVEFLVSLGADREEAIADVGPSEAFEPFTRMAIPDRLLQDGDLADLPGWSLRAVHTPGHTPGHLCFAEERTGLLFSGDHVLPHITPSIGFELGEPGLPLADYLESLRLMTAFADAQLLPAHGPVTDSAHARVAQLLGHHDERLVHTLSALGAETLDAHATARRLAWTRRRTSFTDLDAFNQMLAVNETAAHLDVLVARGQATMLVENEVRHYTAAQRAV
jgi:glyoxylase-like metal-dependent hydrolase (beta-lactamase superfamily II)